MTKQEFSERTKHGFTFYGYMYGTPYDYCGNGKYEPAKIIKMEMSEESMKRDRLKNGLGFYYIWGWPGPDFNRYTIKDYGVTWAFTREEIKPISLQDWEEIVKRSKGLWNDYELYM